jgi:hypothetical protein
MVKDIIDNGPLRIVEGEDEGLGKSEQAENVDDIGLELIEGFAEHIVVMGFQRLEFHEPGEGRMAEDAIELKPPLDLVIALLGAEAVTGSQDKDFMAPQTQGFSHRLAMIIERAGMMWRV